MNISIYCSEQLKHTGEKVLNIFPKYQTSNVKIISFSEM